MFDQSKFSEWRAHLEQQIAEGAVFVGHKPEAEEVIAMMDEIERLLGAGQSTEGAGNG